MVLGGMVRIDLLECEGHPTANKDHIRITPYSNLPVHTTSTKKVTAIFHESPSSFLSRKSKVEVVVARELGETMLPVLELDVKSTGNAERNTAEIVIAGLGFVAIGGNFVSAKLCIWTPDGRGVAVRQPVVKKIGGGFSLDIVRRKSERLIMPRRKSIGTFAKESLQTGSDPVV
jgi:hypothetical protein